MIVIIYLCEYTETLELHTLKGNFYGMWIISLKKENYRGGFSLITDSKTLNPESIQK